MVLEWALRSVARWLAPWPNLRRKCSPLWRRHPHVFGDIAVNGVGDVLRNWEAIKARERIQNGKPHGGKGPLSGVARGLPALAQAATYLSRAERLKITQPADLETALGLLQTSDGASDAEEKLGQALLVLTNWARQQGLDAESALRAANARLAVVVEQSVQEAEIAQLAD